MLRDRQTENIIEEFSKYFGPTVSHYKSKLFARGISRYDALKVFILSRLGKEEKWINKSPEAHSYVISKEEFDSLSEDDFYHAYEWFTQKRYRQM